MHGILVTTYAFEFENLSFLEITLRKEFEKNSQNFEIFEQR